MWIGCVSCVYLLVHRATRERVAALFGAALVPTDRRTLELLEWIIERQTSLACLFGFSALYLVQSDDAERPGHGRLILLTSLLSPALFSKECGLAFAGANLLAAPLEVPRQSRPRIVGAAIAAVALYTVIRLLVVSGAAGRYCNEVGFFDALREVCYDQLSLGAPLQQQVYNAVATFVGILLPGVFDGVGRIQLDPPLLARSAILLGLAVAAWLGATRRSVVLLLAICLIAVASSLAYRDRNQIIGLMALQASAGIGFAQLLGAVRPRWRARWVPILVLALLTCWPVSQALDLRRALYSDVAAMARRDPCSALRTRRNDREMVRRVKVHYGLSNPDCDT